MRSTDGIYAEDYGSDEEESLGGCGGGGGSTGGGESRPKGNGKDQPLFLRKTYELLESCPQHIASWSERGDSIIIYDPEAFSQQVIPQHFAHSNFSSFVRQLNFYGFRKVKLDSKPQSANKWWEFRHDKFQRGKQHLLAHIRRATHGANNDSAVSELKSEVGQLKDKLQEMSNSIDKLTSLVNDLMLDKMNRTSMKVESPKRRKTSRRSSSTMYNNEDDGPMVKTENDQYFSSATHEGQTEDRYPPWFGSGMASSPSVPGMEGVHDHGFSDVLPMVTTEEGGPTSGHYPSSPVAFTHPTGFAGIPGHSMEEEDLPSLGSDPDIETFLQSLEEEEEDKNRSSKSSTSSKEEEQQQVSALEQNLHSLTPDLQKKLVETLVAMGAGQETSSSSAGNRTPPAPIALPLASAALGAFLTQYARSQRARETAKPSGATNQPPTTRQEVESQAC